MNKGIHIVGAARTTGNRDKHDFYPTPKSCTKKLLKKEQFIGSILEPACGTGYISKVLQNHGHRDIHNFDLIQRSTSTFTHSTMNFLSFDDHTFYDNTITNPPYNQATEFVLKAKKITNFKIAMFLKTTFLESVGRYELFKDKNFPLKAIYQFSKRQGLYKYSERKLPQAVAGKGGMVAYAWFVWDRSWKKKPFIDWIL